MIEWVWRRAIASRLFEEVVIATDSEEIAAAGRGFGAHVELTDSAHRSGTDRVAEVVQRQQYSEFDAIVNIQGDEPFVKAEHLGAALDLVRGGWMVGTIASPVADLEAWRDPGVVKVIRREEGGAALFSRSPIPFVRGRDPTPDELAREPFLRHIGVYAYARKALLHWVALPEDPLERLESLEQLRPLMASVPIGVAIVGPADGGVDTPADAERADHLLRTNPSTRTPSYD